MLSLCTTINMQTASCLSPEGLGRKTPPLKTHTQAHTATHADMHTHTHRHTNTKGKDNTWLIFRRQVDGEREGWRERERGREREGGRGGEEDRESKRGTCDSGAQTRR